MYYREKLKSIREREGLTKQAIANILNIDRTSYSHYEKEDDTIPLKHLNTISNYFNVSIDYLFELTTKRNYPNTKENIDKKEVGKRLKNFRHENKITQKKLASVLNTNQSVICAYENGKTLILTSFLYSICKKYKISADYLLGKTNEPKYLK